MEALDKSRDLQTNDDFCVRQFGENLIRLLDRRAAGLVTSTTAGGLVTTIVAASASINLAL
jgi:hypothetical protein